MTIYVPVQSIGPKQNNKIQKKVVNGPGFIVETEGNTSDNVAATTNISNINPFRIVQNLTLEYEQDKQKMLEVGADLLRHLNTIRLGLINGELPEQSMHNLKKALISSNIILKFPDLQQVIDDIILRAEVEIAKIEFKQE